MTPHLKNLLHSYGLLYITITKLQDDRPGTVHESLQKYYESLGPMEDGEPVVVVRVSHDDEARIVPGDAAEKPPDLSERYDRSDVTILDLPEDEFYFFRAFRTGLFELEKQLPSFFLQMALVYAYTLFESYLSEVIRLRYRAYPSLAGSGKQVALSEVIRASSRESLLETIADREVNRLFYEPIVSVLDTLRTRLGFRALTTEFDNELQILSFTRNCIIHNGAKVDPKLVALNPTLSLDQPIEVDLASVSTAIHTCRKFCATVDRAFELLQRDDDLSSATDHKAGPGA